MKTIKILIITGTMHMGGIENQLMHLLRNADKERFQIDFTSTMPDAYYREEIETLGGTFHLIPEMRHSNPFPYLSRLYHIMKDGQYDIVHSHELFHSGIVLMVAALAGVKGRFVHAHNWQDGDGSGKKRPLVRTVYNFLMQKLIRIFSTHQLACSTLAGKFLYGEDILKKNSYHLMYNSVDTGKFLDAYDQKESGDFCDGWCNVLQVGRVTRVKNQLFLAEIAAVLRSRGEKVRILCAGNGDADYDFEVSEYILKHGLQQYMIMLGTRSDIDVLMRKASAFVLPSHYEGMPLVLIEAQASGLPCVCADTFSHEVDFGTGQIQWLSLSAGAEYWADAVLSAIHTGKQEKKAVESAVIKKRFDSKMFAQTLCELYAQCILGAEK